MFDHGQEEGRSNATTRHKTLKAESRIITTRRQKFFPTKNQNQASILNHGLLSILAALASPS
jgi:hypothetical protein